MQQDEEGRNGKKVDNDDSIGRNFCSMVIDGRLRAEVCWVTNRSGGNVLNPEDLDINTGRPVIDVLKENHRECVMPEIGQEGWTSFESYDERLDSVPLDCDQETVTEVTGKMSRGAGPSGVKTVKMNKWMLRYGKPSQALRE